ncbi:ectoine/hydroxyectoine ABC transporter substrate-binding protein EhuB [Streptomyces sp. 6N223]|uniref:ectoine/hydroxyectoine ABC transporter substrate-binding protein EhuB n=1 Tax=Streptomyces sp. 6N223 TaxID=3457412 RepID=UPI003FD6A777
MTPSERIISATRGRGVSRRSLLSGLGALGVLGAAGCSRVAAEGEVEGGDLLARLRDSGTVKLGIASEPPFGYIDEDGEATGEAPEIARVIFERLGVENIEAVPVDFSALIPGLKAQLFDVVSAGMYINADRCAQVLFSEPDYLMLDSAIVRAGNPEGITSYEVIAEKGLKMATGQAYAEIGFAMNAGVKPGNILELPDQVAGLDAVAQGRVAAFVGTNVTVKGAVAGNNRVEATDPFPFEAGGEPSYGAGGFAFRLTEANLRDKFNEELAKLKRNDFRELLDIVEPFGFTRAEMPQNPETGQDLTTEELCRL